MLRGEGPGADVCGRNEPPLVRTSHPGAEAVPAREGQRPVESKPGAPGNATFPPGRMLELLQRRCRSVPRVTAFVWRDEGRAAYSSEAGCWGAGALGLVWVLDSSRMSR